MYGHGITFYMIPQILGINDRKHILDLIGHIKKENTNEKDIETFICEEDYLNEILDEKDVLSFKYLFYTKRNERMIILGVSDDVYPSWLNKIYRSRESSISYSIFKEEFLKKIFGAKHSGNLKFDTLGAEFKEFFPLDSKTLGNHQKSYVDIINSILSRRTLPKKFIISAFVPVLRQKFTAESNVKFISPTLDSIKILAFLRKLELLKGETMENEWEKKACFFVGVLAAKLMAAQFAIRGSTPFVKKLHGLRINEKNLKDIFRETKAKLLEYDIYSYQEFEKAAAEALVKSKDGWKLSPDEISYYFTCGLALGKGFEDAEEAKNILKEVL